MAQAMEMQASGFERKDIAMHFGVEFEHFVTQLTKAKAGGFKWFGRNIR